MRKYFYIVQRNGMITEKEYNLIAYQTVLHAWNEGKIILVQLRGDEAPIAINASDVAAVYTADAYRAFISSARPREYILDGVWYEGKSRQEIRVEEWVAKERAEVKRIEREKHNILTAPPTEAERARMLERSADIRNMLSRSNKK